LKKAPSKLLPASAHIFGPIAASTSRTPGTDSRRGQCLAHGRERLLREARAEPKPQALPVEPQPIDSLVDLGWVVTVEGLYRDAELKSG